MSERNPETRSKTPNLLLISSGDHAVVMPAKKKTMNKFQADELSLRISCLSTYLSAKIANDNKLTKIPQKVDFPSYKILAKN
jgi:hypothetical protein